MTTGSAGALTRAVASLLVRAAGALVPGDARAEWLREWRSELWHATDGDGGVRGIGLVRLAAGAPRDALAVRALSFTSDHGRRRAGAAERTTMMLQELRYAVRGLLRAPGFAFVAVLTLALALAANVAIFALVESVLLSPLPYDESDRLVRVAHPVPGMAADAEWGISEAGFFHFREHARTLDDIGVFYPSERNLGTPEGTVRVRAVGASASLLDVLGARAEVGRLYGVAEDAPGGPAVAVLSHGLWATRFGADPGVVGRSITVDGRPVDVIGVLPRGFEPPARSSDLWLPLQLDPTRDPQNSHYLNAIGRRAPGAAVDAVGAELRTITATFPDRFPGAYSRSFMEEFGFTAAATDLRAHVVGDIRATLWILLGAVGLVLAIACANVVNLFLVRVEARRREVAVRTALGASRARVASLFFTESLAVALVAGAAGVALAAGAIGVLVRLAPAGIPRLADVGVGPESVAFAGALSLLVALVLGAVPLLRHARAHPAGALAGARGATASRRHHAIQGTLVVAQVALALMLLASAGLMVRSFMQLRAVDPGFEPARALALDIALPFSAYRTSGDAAAFQQRLLRDVRALPGVERAAGTTDIPLEGPGVCVAHFTESGIGAPGTGAAPCISMHKVSADFFSTMRIPLVAGRAIDEADERNRTGAALVSRSLAHKLWPGEDAIGKRMRPYMGGAPWHEVVGIVDDVRYDGLDRPPLEVAYYTVDRMPDETTWSATLGFSLVIRARAADPLALAGPVRSIVERMDPSVAVGDVRTLERVVEASTARASFAMMLIAIAAAVALLLGAVGLYGVVSYVVGQRRREMGVRMAMGARKGEVSRLVLGRSLRLALAGVAIGIAGALAATRVLRSLLFEVSATDPLTLAGVSLLLVGVALLASWLPARRAARVDPVEALRSE